MDSSGKGFSSPKNPPNPSSSGEFNENDVSHNQMDSNSKPQNPKKSMVKHFMSPTVSAKSKATVPKKKILAEKNESFTSCEKAHVSQFPVPNSRNGHRHLSSGTSGCHQIAACSYSSKSDDEDASTFSADSSSKPYDPLTNYLSPRPKYLRYKPNRQHEIFLTRTFGEKEDNSFLFTRGNLNSQSQNQEFVEEEKTSKFDQEPLTCYPEECSSEISMVEVEKENDYDGESADDEEEEDEEFEEEKGWSLKGMVKFLLLLVVITLSTSYISTMNDPTPSPVVQAVGVLRDGFYRMRTCLFDVVFTNVHNAAWVNGSGLQIGDAQIGFLEVNKPFVTEIVQMIEPCNELIEDICDNDDMEDDLNLLDWEIAECKEADVGKEESDQFPGWESAEGSEAASDEEFKVEENSEGQHWCAAFDDTQSPSGIKHDNQISEGNQLENDHYTDEFEGSFEEKKSREMARFGLVIASDTITLGAVTCHKDEEVEGVSAEKSGENLLETEWQTSETTSSCVEEAFIGSRNKEVDDSGTDIELMPVITKKVVKFMDVDPFSIAAIWWFSFLSIILAYLIWNYSTRTKEAPEPDSLPEVSDRKEELILVRPSLEFEHKQEKAESNSLPEVSDKKEELILVRSSLEFEHKQEKAESIVKPSSACYSIEETTKQYTPQIQAPSVELLGEFVIGEYSSSLRSCGRKGRIETEEGSINPVSHVHVESQTQPVAQVRLLNASSNTDSSSYGSFTAEKIVPRKEAGSDGDAKLITTPVRRSSRIRNLSIASP